MEYSIEHGPEVNEVPARAELAQLEVVFEISVFLNGVFAGETLQV